MAKFTDTQLNILSAASQRDDRAVELPETVQGKAARKLVDKLIRAGLLEEVSASGSLPVWRRDDNSGPMALRITRAGLVAIDAADETTAAPPETSVRPASTREVATAAPEAIVSRNRISIVAPKSARKRRRPDKAKTKTGSLRDNRSGSIAELEPGGSRRRWDSVWRFASRRGRDDRHAAASAGRYRKNRARACRIRNPRHIRDYGARARPSRKC